MPERRLRLLTVVGARPQFVKAAAVHRYLREHHADAVEETYLHTGQHYDRGLTDVFFDELGLPEPDLNLGIGSGPPGYQIGAMMQGIEAYLREHRSDVVLVYGDTNSTLAGALAASRLHIPVAHVEAGLRSGDKRMQEESNRILTDHISTLLFAPTESAIGNLRREGLGADEPADPHINDPLVVHAGDVMLDNVLHFVERARPPASGRELPPEFVLATVHRAEVVNDPAALAEACRGLAGVAEAVGAPIVLPLHPATRQRLAPTDREVLASARTVVLEPTSYLETLWLVLRARLVVTDSGGLQKEACFLGTPCLVLRDTTEWTELAEEGLLVVAGTTEGSMVDGLRRLGPGSAEHARTSFGGGRASERVCERLLEIGARAAR